MKDVFIVADNIISPLGRTTEENFSSLKNGRSGIQEQHNPAMSDHPFYASLLNDGDGQLAAKQSAYTKFEHLLIASISDALTYTDIDITDKKTVLIISSTKGNISLIENNALNPELKKRLALHTSAELVAGYFHCTNKPLVVSNACISGLLAILIGKRLLQSGQYDHAVVAGADVISKFILSGFESFQAISPGPCKPFDAARNGINLGEGAGTIILSANKNYSKGIRIAGGATSNDANHISGPSRTGDELCQAINKAMQESSLTENDIDLISAHGTGTIYNDEMEALAISLAKLQGAPVHSLKGYYGHTLGAAGIIESIVSVQSLKQDIILKSIGFTELGVTKPLNISTSLQTASLKNCLKTASGFGGCNAALVFSRD
ncbi:MAG: beta-ketoacyl synthase N-terminal-like domain-containing protein [Ferruginibacter sp.]